MYSTQHDVGAVVVDVGNGSSRFGFAGQDHPQAMFPTVIGKTTKVGGQPESKEPQTDEADDRTATYYVGHDESAWAPPFRPRPPAAVQPTRPPHAGCAAPAGSSLPAAPRPPQSSTAATTSRCTAL